MWRLLLHNGRFARLRVLSGATFAILLILAVRLAGRVLAASIHVYIFLGVGLALLRRMLLFRHGHLFSRQFDRDEIGGVTKICGANNGDGFLLAGYEIGLCYIYGFGLVAQLVRALP
jgi:hypothetical protein